MLNCIKKNYYINKCFKFFKKQVLILATFILIINNKKVDFKKLL